MDLNALLADLTEPQRAVVAHAEGPLLVLAGPGSGKTRVITRRAAYLAGTVARAGEILAITFTNKAAGEMRERILGLGVGRRLWTSTFHSLCARLLREYGEAVGIRPNFSIFDEGDQRDVIREATRICDFNEANWRPSVVQNAISDAKNKMLTPAAYVEQAHDFSTKTMAKIYEAYQTLLREQNACDFDDLLMYTAQVLGEQDAVRRTLGERFRYLLIDEYQDTNHAQYLIATRLASEHGNICVTGDPDQSIYGWRGADIHNILDFERDYPSAQVVRLEQNYRSTGGILAAASHLIAHNRKRKEKALWTQNEAGQAVTVWECEDAGHEAAKIAEGIRRHCEAGGQAGDIAIFYRTNALTRVVEDALRQTRIPYQVARGVEFYGRQEIKDVLAYLRAVANPADDAAISRAINTPARGIGKVTVERLRTLARERGVPMGDVIAEVGGVPGPAVALANQEEAHAEARRSQRRGDGGGNPSAATTPSASSPPSAFSAPLRETSSCPPELKAARRKLAPFAALMDDLWRMPLRPVQAVIEAVIDRSGLEKSLRAEGEIDNDRLANVYELVSAARQYDVENPEGSLPEWLHQISLVTDLDSVQLAGGFVTLMTLHAAKGLEFPVVYIIGLEEELLPHHRALMGDDGELEEERRLCFVGMTRARRQLTMSYALYRMVRGVTQRTTPSRFLGELPEDEIQFERLDRDALRGRSTGHLGDYNQADDGSGDDAAGGPSFYPGQTVEHPEYGRGRVMRLERVGRSTYVRIRFDQHGVRAFALDYATLDIVEC